MARKNNQQLICGLDIGSSAVRIAAGQIVEVENKRELQMLGMAEVPSEGVSKGIINSIEEAVSSVSNCLEHLEKIIGVPVEDVWVGVSGIQTLCQKSRGVVAVAKSDGEIGPEDVQRVTDAAETIATPLNYEVLHVIPRTFTVDGQTGIKDPTGMTGIRLEVESQIIQSPTAQIKNLSKTIYRTGVDIDGMVLSILASGEACLTQRQKDLGVLVVNIGASTTSIIVYEEGDILHTAVIPVGSEHITNDLAIGLKVAIDIAEKVKINFGHCVAEDIPKKEYVDLAEIGFEISEQVSKRYIAEIIEARVEEILEKIDKELVQIGRSSLLPAGVVFCGSGSKISGLVDLTKYKLKLPATLGYSIGFQSITDKVNDLGFSTATGLVKWGFNMHKGAGKKIIFDPNRVSKVSGQVKNWFKSLIP